MRGFQHLVGRFGPAGDRALWIFIVGNYNSGTTLLYELLRGAPGVASLDWEGARLTPHFSDPTSYGWPRMWHRCEPEMMHAERSLDGRSARHVKRQWRFASSGSDAVFVEKSITNAIRIPFLIEHFSPSFFIHIVRNPYASAEGIHRNAKPDPTQNPEGLSDYPLQMCARQWVEANSRIERDLPADHSIRIQYEDLCTDPAATLHSIAAACPMLGTLAVPADIRVHGATGSITNQNEAAISRLSASSCQAIGEEAGNAMKNYGYALLDTQ